MYRSVRALMVLLAVAVSACHGAPESPTPTPPALPVHTITGVVTETVPTAATPIVGGKVEVTTGPYQGAQATTDSAGSYSITGVRGEFDLSISASGYDTRTVRVNASDEATHVDVALLPNDQPETTTLSGRLCGDYQFWAPQNPLPPFSCTGDYPHENHHSLAVHRAGELTIAMAWDYKEDYSTEFMWLEVRCDTPIKQLFGKNAESPVFKTDQAGSFVSGDPTPLRVAVSGPAVCDIKPYAYRSFKGAWPWTEYRIAITHPK